MGKKSFQFILLFIVLVAVFMGCTPPGQSEIKSDKINIVTTFYPLAYLSEQIGGERVHVINLIGTGVEPHDWTPKASDLRVSEQAQLFLYNGLGFEGWVEDFLEGLSSDRTVLPVAISEQHVQVLEQHGVVDPHSWVSPKSLLKMAQAVYEAIVRVDAAHQAAYKGNYESLLATIEAMDVTYTSKLNEVSNKNLVVSHDAFSYLARDYGLVIKPIMGLSPDAEPKAQDLAEVAAFVRDEAVRTIYFEELVSDELAQTIASETGAQTKVLNPLEGLTHAQATAGDDLMTILERNLTNLVEGLE